ncbi:MAG: hypothetical protein WKG00_10725 [Polyangiaceae bacterium]
MAQTLILDAEALNALAHPRERGALALRARSILEVSRERRAMVRVPAPVLVEVCRDSRRDAAIAHLLGARGIGVVPADRAISQAAGHLLARHGLSSAHAVDALLVATAFLLAPSAIATGDPKDIRLLTSSLRGVQVIAL